MRERATVAGGTFSITSEPGKGTTITATFPRVWVRGGPLLEAGPRRRASDPSGPKLSIPLPTTTPFPGSLGGPPANGSAATPANGTANREAPAMSSKARLPQTGAQGRTVHPTAPPRRTAPPHRTAPPLVDQRRPAHLVQRAPPQAPRTRRPPTWRVRRPEERPPPRAPDRPHPGPPGRPRPRPTVRLGLALWPSLALRLCLRHHASLRRSPTSHRPTPAGRRC